MRAGILAVVVLATVILTSGEVWAAGKLSSVKPKPAITYSFKVNEAFANLLTLYSEGEWVAAAGADIDLQRKIQSCLRVIFDRSTWSGDQKVSVIAYDRSTGSAKYVDEIMEKLFPGEIKGFLVLTVEKDDFVAAFISTNSSGEMKSQGACE